MEYVEYEVPQTKEEKRIEKIVIGILLVGAAALAFNAIAFFIVEGYF